jgi:SNF2 family DNA or RNA helicase
LCDGTIDEDIYSLIERKRNVVNQAVDGSPAEDAEGASQLILRLLGVGQETSE